VAFTSLNLPLAVATPDIQIENRQAIERRRNRHVQEKAYDLVIIGGGPAGIVGAATASRLGKSVALVDGHHELGGAGINTGTVPSKTLRETALALSGLRSRDLYGVDLSLRREATVEDFLHHARAVKVSANAMLSELLEASGSEVYAGSAAFADEHTVSVKSAAQPEVLLRGERVLIATGSAPIRPSIYPFGPGIYDSDTILELTRLPRSIAIIGAGVIGSEYACTFSTLGTQVHIIDGRDALLPFLDREISTALEAAMEHGGVTFHWRERTESCTKDGAGQVTVALASGKRLLVDAVLAAAGRSGNTDTLRLSAAGISAGAHGTIEVDEHFRTSVPHIFAAGDVVGPPALASTSMRQARVAVARAFNADDEATAPRQLPYGVYTIPEIGTIGETESALEKRGAAYFVGRARYESNFRGRIVGDAGGFLKLLFDRGDRKLLGVHVIGEQATELVHLGMMAMLAGLSADVIAEACFNTPTLGELYASAAFDALRNAPAN
jgi:NAD(P) transhydrogenase